ncbi:STAS/SEC14 domain-containing protein [Sorangium sp. So ce124]|uniref:STAS/SEC14 domain-containing protein n=1 Tax=Sorangium sp. So ce124 TaxID=3133280 RepID=UPI003F5DE95B
MSDPRPEGARLDLREEPDGVLFITVVGDISEQMARTITAACQRLRDSGRDVLVLSDARGNGAISPQARKAFAEGLSSARLDAVALFGASFSLRVIGTLIFKSMNLLAQRSHSIAFFDTEGEARAWLLAQRDALRAGRQPGA